MKDLIDCAAKRGMRAADVLLAVDVFLFLTESSPAACSTLDVAITCRLDIAAQLCRANAVLHESSVVATKNFLVKANSYRTDKANTRGS
jgi:MinD superfamily P-loop ATPase